MILPYYQTNANSLRNPSLSVKILSISQKENILLSQQVRDSRQTFYLLVEHQYLTSSTQDRQKLPQTIIVTSILLASKLSFQYLQLFQTFGFAFHVMILPINCNPILFSKSCYCIDSRAIVLLSTKDYKEMSRSLNPYFITDIS